VIIGFHIIISDDEALVGNPKYLNGSLSFQHMKLFAVMETTSSSIPIPIIELL
jgi:hypothetical protein